MARRRLLVTGSSGLIGSEIGSSFSHSGWQVDGIDTNAVRTLDLLETARRSYPVSPLVHLSTNKVCGDKPRSIPLFELETRWDSADPACPGSGLEPVTIEHFHEPE